MERAEEKQIFAGLQKEETGVIKLGG